MTYPPPGGSPDPLNQPPHGQQPPYGQPPSDPTAPIGQPYSDPYAQPGSASAPPWSGQPASAPPAGGQPFGGQYPPSYPPPAQARTTNVLAILSLVFAFVFSPAGIVLGHMAKKQIKERGEDGEGLATAGLITSYVITGLYVLGCCGGIIAVIMAEGANSTSY